MSTVILYAPKQKIRQELPISNRITLSEIHSLGSTTLHLSLPTIKIFFINSNVLEELVTEEQLHTLLINSGNKPIRLYFEGETEGENEVKEAEAKAEAKAEAEVEEGQIMIINQQITIEAEVEAEAAGAEVGAEVGTEALAEAGTIQENAQVEATADRCATTRECLYGY